MTPHLRIPLLSPEECVPLREAIHQLRPYWVQRHPKGPYFTLGASNYWDLILKSKEDYLSQAHRLNPVLWRVFRPLYDRLLAEFSARAKVKAEYDANLPLPGFHIFLGDETLSQCRDTLHGHWFEVRSDPDQFSNSIHCDTPHLWVNFGDRPIDPTEGLSFTGAIALPKEGSGLYTWDLTYDEGRKIDEDDLPGELAKREKSYHPYEEGVLFVHPGMVYHQIAKLENVKPGEERITLQGHVARRRTGEWVLFW